MEFEYNATVTDRVDIAPGLMSLRIRPDTLPFEFKSGQYVVLGLRATELKIPEAGTDGDFDLEGDLDGPSDGRLALEAQAAAARLAAADPNRMLRRSYCIVSDGRPGGNLEFYITLIMSGELTPRLFNLKASDRLHVGPRAEGVFTIDRAEGRHILMVATGTGLAPYMSMMRNELGLGPNGRPGVRALWQCNAGRHFVVVHGAKHSWDLGYRSELTRLASRCANFHYLPAITRPAEDTTWQGRTGYVQTHLASGIVERETGLTLSPDAFDIFLCGNPGMIDSVTAWAEVRGFARDRGHVTGRLHAEHYW